MIPFKPNYSKAVSCSVEIIDKYKIDELPIDIFKIINDIPEVKICSYSKFAKKNNCTIKDIVNYLESDLGVCSYDEVFGRAVIYYNDTTNNDQLNRFTIAHELGHYILKHFEYIDGNIMQRGGFRKIEYENFEKETNCFARNLLSPAPLVHFFKVHNVPDRIMKIFDIGYKAARARMDFFHFDFEKINKKIIDFFKKRFINRVSHYQNLKECMVCTGLFANVNSKYCPICGSKDIRIKKGIDNFNMKYEGIETNEIYIALKCPKCDNEETDGYYCKICRTEIQNTCTKKCSKQYSAFEGNARYCIYCGAETTFYQNGFLEAWDGGYYNEVEQTKITHNSSTFEEYDNEADLPF